MHGVQEYGCFSITKQQILQTTQMCGLIHLLYKHFLDIYSGTSLLWTFRDREFLATFCCNIVLRGKNLLIRRPVGTKIFVLIMEVFSIVSLIRGVC